MEIPQWIAEVAPFAVEDMMNSKVLASVTIAQSILESDHGNRAPMNNFFGIKSNDGTGQLLWTKEYVRGKWIDVQAWFRAYPDLEGCIADHSNFLTVNTRYANAGFFSHCANLDWRGACNSLQSAGYATDPKYAQSLIDIIMENKLYLYDKEAYDNMKDIFDLQTKVTAIEDELALVRMPDWFATEFGANCLDGILNDPMGNANFWRDVAMTIRIKRSSL